jgi:hypothetical protein
MSSTAPGDLDEVGMGGAADDLAHLEGTAAASKGSESIQGNPDGKRLEHPERTQATSLHSLEGAETEGELPTHASHSEREVD